jgi:PAS domain S-box-containing protein
MTDKLNSAEKSPRESDEKYQQLFQLGSDAIFLIDNETGNILEVNEAACKLYGFSRDTLLKIKHTDLSAEPKETRMVTLEGKTFIPVRWHRKKDQTIFPVEIAANHFLWQGRPVHIAAIRDITDRKRAEEQIHRQSKLLAAINKVFFKTLTADSEEDVAKTCLSVAQEITESKFGFIGEITPEGLFSITSLSDPGWEACRILETQANVLVKDMVIRGILGQVLLKEQSFIVNDPASSPDRVSIPEGHPPLTSFLGVPLKDQGKVIGMIAMANNASGYTAEHQQDMKALSVAFMEAIRRKQAEEELKQTLEHLRRAFSSIVQVMVSAVKIRDPYTAIHQLRSADLARSIAKEMGFNRDRIEVIRIVASIHDIGKLSIPSETLSKTTRLSELEFSLIKGHCRSGYEILKNVESPWPLAEIVYQHHERMDGSGYPRKLKGDDILMEARILAVCDVVEAMASHRPYRAALGINAALEEIEENKETLYDADVVDTCLRLFREKGYKFGREAT